MEVFGIIIIAIFLAGCMLYFLSLINLFVYKVPHVATFNSDVVPLREAFDYYKIGGKRIADLGSGSGKITRILDKYYGVKVTGYEIDASNYYYSKVLNFLHKRTIEIIKGNYLKANLYKYDCIYIYLYPCLIDKIEDKIFSECKNGTLIFVNAFPFNKHTPINVFKRGEKEQIYVYKVGD